MLLQKKGFYPAFFLHSVKVIISQENVLGPLDCVEMYAKYLFANIQDQIVAILNVREVGLSAFNPQMSTSTGSQFCPI